jgi:hypothetical protein
VPWPPPDIDDAAVPAVPAGEVADPLAEVDEAIVCPEPDVDDATLPASASGETAEPLAAIEEAMVCPVPDAAAPPRDTAGERVDALAVAEDAVPCPVPCAEKVVVPVVAADPSPAGGEVIPWPAGADEATEPLGAVPAESCRTPSRRGACRASAAAAGSALRRARRPLGAPHSSTGRAAEPPEPDCACAAGAAASSAAARINVMRDMEAMGVRVRRRMNSETTVLRVRQWPQTGAET